MAIDTVDEIVDDTPDAEAAEKALDDKALDAFDAENTPEVTGDDTETKDEIPAASDDKPAGGDDETATDDVQAGGSEDWVTSDDNRELRESLGLSEEEVREFSGPEELERHATLLDRRFRDAGKQTEEQETALKAKELAQDKLDAQERANKRERDADGKFTSEDDGYKSGLDPDDFDENVIAEFGRLNEHHEQRYLQQEQRYKQQEERLEQIESRYRDTEDRQINARFDAAVDALDNEELFGTSAAPNVENRVRVRKAYDIIALGTEGQGQSVEITPVSMKRAQNLEFADELNTQHRTSLSQKLKSQSQRKLGGGGGQRTAPDKNQEWTGEPEDDPVLVDAYNKANREGGAS